MPPYESNCTALDMKRTPILSSGPRLEVVEGNVRKIHGEAPRDPPQNPTRSKPFVHLDGILAHALTDDIERDLIIGKVATGDPRENAHGVITCELVAREVENASR